MSYAPKQTLYEGYNKFVIRKENGCWDWTGCCPKNPGYGQFRSEGKLFRAHRASWMIHKGEIPAGLFVLHKCDNKLCSNPDHLFLGNDLINNKDAYEKGINKICWANGEKNPHAKLKLQQIKEIRKSNLNKIELSKIYKVSSGTIRSIRKNLTWKEGTNH